MRLTVTKLLNKRIGAPSVNAPKGIPLEVGDEIEVVGQVKGDSYDGNDIWYKDEGNNYYWSGGVELHIDNHKFSPAIVKSFISSEIKITQPWFEDTLKIPELWNTYNSYGEDVTVAILDTGYDIRNPDLAPNILDSTKFIDYADSVQDTYGHGTRCASIVGAANNLKWNIGIAPKCKLLIVKVSSAGELNNFDPLINGINWAIKKGADIISISFGKSSRNQTVISDFYTSINKSLENKNVLLFAACGNNYASSFASGNIYPSGFALNSIYPSIEKMISIGAVDEKNNLAPITLQNDYTILHAPGTNIRSFITNNETDFDSGTSMATPIVAGIAALAISHIKKINGGNWNWKELKNKIISTADPIKSDSLKKSINPIELFKSL
jgi:subtilisin family serine protease